MLETAVVVSTSALFWHLPPGRSTVSIPDTSSLWDVLWAARNELVGVAHSHPGRGVPQPSLEDLTTFAAVESALGRRLSWWIISVDQVIHLRWCGPKPMQYAEVPVVEPCSWLDQLRRLSYQEP